MSFTVMVMVLDAGAVMLPNVRVGVRVTGVLTNAFTVAVGRVKAQVPMR